MRAGAQLREFPLFVEGNRLALLRMLADELHLIGFVFLLHNLNRIIRRKLKPLQRQRFLHDFFHFGFNFGERLRGERLFRVEIVVKAVVNCRADRELRLWIQPLDRLRHNMGGRVPEGALALRIVKGEN